MKYPSVPIFLARHSHFWHPSSDTMPLQMPMLCLHKISGDLTSAVSSPHIYETLLALTLLETNHTMFFLHDNVERSNLASTDAQNALSDGNSFYDEDYDNFGSVSSGELEDKKVEDDPGHQLGDDQPSEAPPAPSTLGLPDNSDPSNSPPSLTTTAMQNANTNDDGNTSQDNPKPPKGKSIAHYDLKANQMMFVSLEVEWG